MNFFASTCAPCVTEMPAFEEVYQDLGGEQVAFLGLAVADRPEDAQALVDQTGVTYPTAPGPGRLPSSPRWAASCCPTTVLLDADGTVVATHNGALDADELRALIADELGVSGVNEQTLVLAFAAGMLATVNPCGFAMLPGLPRLLPGHRGRRRATCKASVSRSLGVGAVGVGRLPGRVQPGRAGDVPPLGDRSTRWTPWATIVIGIVARRARHRDAPRASSRW